MKDNFDLYSWNKNRYLNKEHTLKESDSNTNVVKDFDLREWNKKRYLGELNISSTSDDDQGGGETNVDNVNLDRGGDDAKMGAEEESDSNVVGEAEEREYEVEYWILTNDGYDNEYIEVKAKSEKDALIKAKEEIRRGKNFKIYKR
tara:strand:+ start:693 stop:1130 length:438 start_codon:yes stop_codon:yes gene_type:complete